MRLRAWIWLTLAGCSFFEQPVAAQWRKVSHLGDSIDFNHRGGDGIGCVYFLDRQGLPNVGFAGGHHMWKTTDRGVSWDTCRLSWPADFTDISFRDTVTGWASSIGGYGCYKTTNGGTTWFALSVIAGTYAVYYNDSTGKLLLGAYDTTMLVSGDLGETWQSLPVQSVVSLSFSDGSHGIASTWPYWDGIAPFYTYVDTQSYIFVTSDGGATWDKRIRISLDSQNVWWVPTQLLAVQGTPTCFAVTGGGIVIFRSDDYGWHWRKIRDDTARFPTQVNTGVIAGDLRRLMVQTDSGLWVSIDEGISWTYDHGPGYTVVSNACKFYCANGRTVAGEVFHNGGYGGLWEEDWGTAGVAEPPASQLNSLATPNPAEDVATISFTLAQDGFMKIELFDALGRVSGAALPRSLPEGDEYFTKGTHSVPISLRGLPAGVYYARISTSFGFSQTVMLVKE
ncbi:MAG: T9SS type A sorting domain-containing protein [Bacteroidota bacterium]|nr:T9SS type A sorting domain-containing protein [Bacteroidota bacterium]MDP4233937.1 T9SS type A sorting domain-containing protein [Bacteroidota bacterium]MDP4242812.1 T9SS type A sorting domain-containing protein [Bacteroidota bacterium]MDP4288290.1 T9SS type A sorting domain-containing protein [Bacteroidota bacterium]